MSDLFRKKSLENLSSPERLDTLTNIIFPKNWLIIFSIFIIVLGIMFWAFFGTISTKVYGEGILIKSGGILSVQHISSGKITDLKVSPGDFVNKGDVIARLEKPDLLKQIRETKNKIKNLEEQNLKKIEKELKLEKSNLEILYEELDFTSKIVSPYTGIVIELMVDKGSYINMGDKIITMEAAGKNIKDLEPIIYIPAVDGKKVKIGDEILILPSNIKKEEYGYMIGRIRYVAEYPSTQKGMMRVLNNNEIVEKISEKGPLVEILVDLIPTSKTESSYKWTSKNGPPVKIQSGSLCQAVISVQKYKPIDLLISF